MLAAPQPSDASDALGYTAPLGFGIEAAWGFTPAQLHVPGPHAEVERALAANIERDPTFIMMSIAAGRV